MREPIYLDDPRFSTADAIKLSGVSPAALANGRMSSRGYIKLGTRGNSRGRYGDMAYSMIDVLQLATLHDLTTRVHLHPADAAAVAEILADEVTRRARRDSTGRAIADLTGIPARLAFLIATLDGKPSIETVVLDGKHADAGTWSRAHIVLPVTDLVRDVFWKAIGAEMALV